MPSKLPIVITRSIIPSSWGLNINLTLKKGESWILIDQMVIAKGVLNANSPSHQITINQSEKEDGQT